MRPSGVGAWPSLASLSWLTRHTTLLESAARARSLICPLPSSPDSPRHALRSSIYYTAPAMVATPSLGLDITAIGVISSVFPLAYGCSKFVSGVVGDVLSPRAMLASGLALTACVNLAFGCGSSLGWFVALWGFNGILQGWGGPACAKIITSWFASGERGTYWGLWNISHNFGAALAPLLAGAAAMRFGWRYGVWAPAAVALVVSAFVVLTVRDSPESLGRIPAEDAWGAADDADGSGTSVSKDDGGSASKDDDESTAPQEVSAVSAEEGGAVAVAAVSADGSGGGMLDRLVNNVLTNPRIWVLALSFLCVYLMRQGLTTWLVFYLIETKGLTNVAQASARVSGLEYAAAPVHGACASRSHPSFPCTCTCPFRTAHMHMHMHRAHQARRACGLPHRWQTLRQAHRGRQARPGLRRPAAVRGKRLPCPPPSEVRQNGVRMSSMAASHRKRSSPRALPPGPRSLAARVPAYSLGRRVSRCELPVSAGARLLGRPSSRSTRARGAP